MIETVYSRIGRRNFLAGTAAAAGLLVLPGCVSVGHYSDVEAIRRLLTLAARNAFAKLTAPDGFWDSAVARIEMPVLFGKRGSILQGILSSTAFREQLQHKLNNIAEDGARRAAPVVADAVRTIGIANAAAIIRGEPTSATTFLRQAMGPRLVNEMIPELDKALRIANDPIIGQAISVLAGVDLSSVAHAVAIGADNALWYAIGDEEAAIRAHPEETHDPVLIGALKVL